MATSFNSFNPATGQVIGRYPLFTNKQVAQIVADARSSVDTWEALEFVGRKKTLLTWSKAILANIGEISELISLETGKPLSDSRLEVLSAVNHIGWAARHAPEIMRRSHRAPGVLMAHMSATVERSPLGVIGVIRPWNYPLFTPIGSIAYALAAGNTVVFKPSEYATGVGSWIGQSFNAIAPSSGILTVITGDGVTGNALCISAIDKLSFTGSTATAKLVAAACATQMTPVVLECGGKDPVIVAADAHLDRAVDATIWSAMANAGQSCIGAERVYVDDQVADRFIEKAITLASTLTADAPGRGNYGPATMPSQISIISSHLKAAVKDGGRFAYGSLKSIKAPFVQPIILVDVPENSVAMREETFGPVIIINRVKSMNEAVDLANRSQYGLGASVWSKRYGKRIASQLHCGMVAINSTFSFAAISSLPFGGVKQSGYGRVHGPEGLLEYTYPRAVVRTRFNLPFKTLSFGRRSATDQLLYLVTKLLKGRLG